jgi:hypothetical protein
VFIGYRVGTNNSMVISHLQFADETLLFRAKKLGEY